MNHETKTTASLKQHLFMICDVLENLEQLETTKSLTKPAGNNYSCYVIYTEEVICYKVLI